MTQYLEHRQNWEKFHAIVRELTPEEAPAILARPNGEKPGAFLNAVERRYLPMNGDFAFFSEGQYVEDELEILLQGIPYCAMGMEDEISACYTGEFRTGIEALTQLAGNYVDPPGAETECLVEMGVSPETLRRASERAKDGPQNIARALRERNREAAAMAVLWINQQTGHIFLDINLTDLIQESYTSNDPWELEILEEAAKLWREQAGLEEEINAELERAGRDPEAYLKEILTLLEQDERRKEHGTYDHPSPLAGEPP